MSKSVLIFLILVLVSSTIYVSGQSISYKAGLTVSAGAAVFNNPAYDSVAVVEFLFSISRNSMTTNLWATMSHSRYGTITA